jgi:hypothetical protein
MWGSRLRLYFEENLFGNSKDIWGRVSHIVLEKPVDSEGSYIEAFIDKIFWVGTTLGGIDSD